LKRRLISLLLTVVLVLSFTVTTFAYNKNDLQGLYDTVATYIFTSEKLLENTLTESEDAMCATTILIAKKALLSNLFSEEEYDVIYRELYSVYGFMTLATQRNNAMTNPKVTKLLKTVSSIVVNNSYYKIVDSVTADAVKSVVTKSLEYINNSDKYPQDDMNAQMNQFFITLQDVARQRSEFFNAQYGARLLEDIDSSQWFYNAVNYVYSMGLFKGTSTTTFSPNEKMTRGMFITVLSRMAGLADTYQGASPFVDVDPAQYYAAPIAWANNGGMISWVGSNKFNPDAPITREEMVTTMYNYCRYIALDFTGVIPTSEEAIPDIGNASFYSKDALRYAHAMKIISGYEDGSLRPQGTATRAEVAQVFINFSNVVK